MEQPATDMEAPRRSYGRQPMKETQNLGFKFRDKGNEISIFHNGKLATTLRGNRSDTFRFDVSELSFPEQQQLMARLTGNYKHGNERTAKNHPRNQS